MADDDTESIGGISVGIGADHSSLVARVGEANRILDALERRVVTVQITGNVAGLAAGGSGRAPGPTPIRYGAAATTGVQAAQGGTALQRRINEELAKTGERLDANGDIVSATTAKVQAQRTAIVGVQQAAAEPTKLNIDTAALQNDLQTILSTLREITAEAAKLPAATARASTGGRGSRGGAARVRSAAPASDREEGETEEIDPYRIAYVDRIERQRRRAASAGLGTLDINRSEQALARQRQREEAAARRQEQSLATATARATAHNNRIASAQALHALSAQAQAAGVGVPSSATFAPPATQESLAALYARPGLVGASRPAARAQDEAQQRRLRAQAFVDRLAPNPTANVEQRFDVRVAQAALQNQVRNAQIERSIEENRIRIEAQATTAPRTAGTAASGLGGLLAGPRRSEIEAEVNLQAARSKTAAATQYRLVFEKEIAIAETKAATASDDEARNLRSYATAVRDSTQYKDAIAKQGAAIDDEADAAERLRKVSTGAVPAIRSLASVTLAGAAFGIGLKGIDFVLAAVGKGLDNIIDIGTGFATTTNRVTNALGQQTIALHGNATQAVATAEAQAGLSVEASKGIDTQLTLAARVKAGAQTAQGTQDLFRAAIASAGGGAPQGLLGGYGGVLGGPLFAQQLGGGKGLAETIKDTFGDFTARANQIAAQNAKSGLFGEPQRPQYEPGGAQIAALEQVSTDRIALEKTYADAITRGTQAIGDLSTSGFRFAQISDDQVAKLQTSNLPQELKDNASHNNEALVDATGNLVTNVDVVNKALEALAAGLAIQPPEQIGRANLDAERRRQQEAAASLGAIRSQQQYELPSIVAAVVRQQQYQTGTQLPAQFRLGALANPNLPVGTGIAPANAQEAARVAGSLKDARDLQAQLNIEYDKGRQAIAATYDPAIVNAFGQAGLADFHAQLALVEQTGKQIAGIQAGISNEQAAYQTAQYNYQLIIAKRTLSDIGGLLNKNLGAGESEYGVLERQNLLLSRQAQQLQFALSQRQINFQVAQAGFVVPGVTPEERQANIKEAQIEASFAQKQLDLQKAQFKNQVQLVDIGNLREGRDLLRQIGLLQQGRAVTLDTAAAEQKITRLNQLQSQEVARVSSYLTAVDNLTSTAFGQIQQLEAAAGKAMANIATDVLGQFGIFLHGLSTGLSGIGGGGGAAGGGRPLTLASGGVLGLTSATAIGNQAIAGEAGNETLIVLSHPRGASLSGGSGGGNTFVVNFNGPIGVRNKDQIDEISREVMRQLGRTASTLGLRSVG